jgi:hypothetical protein
MHRESKVCEFLSFIPFQELEMETKGKTVSAVNSTPYEGFFEDHNMIF